MKRLPLSQTILSVAGVAILCTLGTWQVQRLQWKNEMIEKLEHDYASMKGNSAPLVPLEKLQELSMEHEPFAIGKVRGRFLRDDSILLGPKPEDGRIGYHLLVPLAMDNGQTLIVNTGWVDAMWKDNPQERLAGLPQDPVTITGVLRKPDWNSFTSGNSPENDMWFRADITQIAQEKSLEKPYLFLMYANAVQPSLHDVKPIEEHWLPRNKHMQYAIFWYSMALTLIAVYGFYWKSRKQ